ncbi:MAG: penicillin-binding protein 2 [Candidatus Sungbacteria bacterium]|nr:penicillin-binding protein 2 [Candidatus Sungbacteria bacterium]
MKKRSDDALGRRLMVVLIFFFIAFGALVSRLFFLQIVHHNDYRTLASKQHRIEEDIISLRGKIFAQDKTGGRVPLALPNLEKSLVAVPKSISEKDAVIEFMAEEFKLDEKIIQEKIGKENDPYEVLVKKVDPIQAAKLDGKLPSGLFFEEAQGRVYPHAARAAHVLGFVNKNEEDYSGRYGIERQYQNELAGGKEFFDGIQGSASFWMALGRRIINPPKNGSDIVLTVDYNIQAKAEEILLKAKEKWGAASGTVLVTDPTTGRILANASLPAFDPNQYGKERDLSVFLNPGIESMYEFGSVIKPLTMAAGIEEKLVSPTSTYYDTGEVKFGSYTIRNFDTKAYYTQTMTQVLENSLNTGMVHVAKLLGKERQLQYLQKFGLGEKTKVDLPGEVSGNIGNLVSLQAREIDFATASFGQGIAVTPIQLAAAVGALANEGILKRPYIVEKIIDGAGNETLKESEDVRRVVSAETAETLTKMLVSVVRNGFENYAGVKGYFVAGKTGTAQISKKDGKGYSDKVIHTFVGYAPAFRPKFLALIQLNDPKGNRFAANTLTPAFHDLAQYILNYYEVVPDEK